MDERLKELLEVTRKYLYNEMSFATAGRSERYFSLLSNKIIEENELRISISDIVKFLNKLIWLDNIKNIKLNRCSQITFLDISFDITLKYEQNHINLKIFCSPSNEKKIYLTIDNDYTIEEKFDRILNLCAEHKFDKFVGIHVSKYKQFRAV